jgi:hypothetical protein
LISDHVRKAAQACVDATLDESGERDRLRLCVSWALAQQDGWMVSFGTEVVSGHSRSVVKGPRLQRVHADLIRCIFGNPFREAAFDPAWRTSAAVALATQMYESRDFGSMAILADALEDAGCDSDDVIAHCRDPKGCHARGCWVVDRVLGKA